MMPIDIKGVRCDCGALTEFNISYENKEGGKVWPRAIMTMNREETLREFTRAVIDDSIGIARKAGKKGEKIPVQLPGRHPALIWLVTDVEQYDAVMLIDGETARRVLNGS